MYSRETNLDNIHMLHSVPLKNPQATALYLAIAGSYLTLYCSDNIIYVYLVDRPSADTFKLDLLHEISLVGIVNQAGRVRGLSLVSANGIAGRCEYINPTFNLYFAIASGC